ncbi:MAG TPA: DinB family protein [Vicinamibacterales bacterium]|nr:DinB family protein [Vicinamibacterales bacterium]HQZ38536.1 DinB family protein [Vicinamibacterales bacterium]
MKSIVATCAVLTAVLAITVSRPAAQGPSIQAELLKDLTNQKEQMGKIADAMPEDKFGFKSTPAQRSYGEQIMHVAGANVMILKTLGAKATPPTMNPKATAKAEILKALADSYDFGIASVKEQTDQTMMQAVQGPGFLGSSTRTRITYFVLNHAMDIYGQMAVYLRLNGIVPPASRTSM